MIDHVGYQWKVNHRQIVTSRGQHQHTGEKNKEQILICDIDFKKVDTVRQHWPFLRDRRIDSYKGILKNPKDD